MAANATGPYNCRTTPHLTWKQTILPSLHPQMETLYTPFLMTSTSKTTSHCRSWMERYIPKTRGEQVERLKDTKKIKTQGLNGNCQTWARFCNRWLCLSTPTGWSHHRHPLSYRRRILTHRWRWGWYPGHFWVFSTCKEVIEGSCTRHPWDAINLCIYSKEHIKSDAAWASRLSHFSSEED